MRIQQKRQYQGFRDCFKVKVWPSPQQWVKLIRHYRFCCHTHTYKIHIINIHILMLIIGWNSSIKERTYGKLLRCPQFCCFSRAQRDNTEGMSFDLLTPIRVWSLVLWVPSWGSWVQSPEHHWVWSQTQK